MRKPLRLTKQKQQEIVSRHQLSECFTQFGWLPYSPEDLGEDFFVHIYYEGRATGVSFYVQEKSVTDLEKYKTQDGDFISYRFMVKDLLHWEGFNYPLILVVWDVSSRNGRWALLSDVLPKLNEKSPQWREKTKVSIQIPMKNSFDEPGLRKLRETIGKCAYPLISKGKSLDMTWHLSFPDTPEGKEKREKFERFLKYGEDVSISKDVIADIELSDWAQPWLLDHFAGENTEGFTISFFPPNGIPILKLDEVLHLDLYFWGNNGEKAVLHDLEFSIRRKTPWMFEISNEHQKFPIQLDILTIEEDGEEKTKPQVTLRDYYINVKVAIEVAKLVNGFVDGGRLSLFSSQHQQIVYNVALPPKPGESVHPFIEKLISTLYTIQEKTRQFIKIPAGILSYGVTEEEYREATQLIQTVEAGRISWHCDDISEDFEVSHFITGVDELADGKPLHFVAKEQTIFSTLFDQQIIMGPFTKEVIGYPDMPINELEQIVRGHTKDAVHALTLRNVQLTVTFIDWCSTQHIT